jgi:putative CocE/NonD family hydrolase
MRAILAILLIALPAAAREHFDSASRELVMIPMRDGIRLSTFIYHPAVSGKPAPGKFPVLVERTPYGKAGRHALVELVARRGYVVLLQDCRGRYESEGEFYPFTIEGPDGYDTVEWAAMQPWSDGRVGTFGGSYTGMDQYATAILRPPHLVAMFIQMAGTSLYESVPYPGGAPAAGWLIWMMRSAATSPQAEQHKSAAEAITATSKSGFREWFRQPPGERPALLKDFPVHARVYKDFYDHPTLDSYWKQPGFYAAGYFKEMKDVPTLYITGWYDIFAQGTLDAFMTLARTQKTEKKLLVGPWPHGIGGEECGEAYFGPEAKEDQGALVADWFDHLLRNDKYELLGPEPVRIYRMGGGDWSRTDRRTLKFGGEWRTATTWPPADVKPARYYLRAGGLLDMAKPADEGPSRYEYDPANPAPTVGGRNNTLPGAPACIQNIAALEKRSDVLSFSTAALKAPVEVTGRLHATLWIASEATDTDFVVRLADVDPNGYAALIADGELRARYRKGFDKPEKLKPGEAAEITVDLGSTSMLFAAGHRIRLQVTSSSFPKLEPNPNTGDLRGWWTKQEKTRNTVFHDGAHASYLELAVLWGRL